MINWKGALFGAVVTLLFLATPVRADLQSAQRSYEQGRTAEALTEVDRLLASNPEDPEVRFLQGIIYAEQGRNGDAIEIFAGLTQDYPELPEPYNNLAVLFAENGEFEKARDALMSAIQTHPSYSTAHENLGDLYAKMAGMAYDRALTEDRGNDSARIKLSAVNGLFSVPRIATDKPPVVVAAAEPTPRPALPQPEPVTPVVQPQPQPQPEPVTPPVAVVTQPQPEPRTPPVAVVTQPQPQPQPTPVVSAPPVQDASGDVVAAVTRWAQAWTSQNVDGYLGSYAASFQPPNGASRGAWETYRRSRINAPAFVQVDVDGFQIDMVDADTARVTFRQAYRSDTYQDVVSKTMTLTRVGGEWRIASETSQPI